MKKSFKINFYDRRGKLLVMYGLFFFCFFFCFYMMFVICVAGITLGQAIDQNQFHS